MTIDEFDPDDMLLELNRKLANVCIQSDHSGETVHKDAVRIAQTQLQKLVKGIGSF